MLNSKIIPVHKIVMPSHVLSSESLSPEVTAVDDTRTALSPHMSVSGQATDNNNDTTKLA